MLSVASACMVMFKGRRILLTVQHAVKRQGIWAMEIAYRPPNGTLIYQLGPMNFFVRVAPGKRSRHIDFAYVCLPDDVQPLIQEVSPRGEIYREEPRLTLDSALDQEPQKGMRYGFAGFGNNDRSEHAVFGDVQLEDNLSFLRERSGLYYFRLNHDHPGHEVYEGCSGAPILSQEGDLVGLVVGGSKSAKTIRAVALPQYRGVLEVSLENSGK